MISEEEGLEERAARMSRLETLHYAVGGIVHDLNNKGIGAMGNLAMAREDVLLEGAHLSQAQTLMHDLRDSTEDIHSLMVLSLLESELERAQQLSANVREGLQYGAESSQSMVDLVAQLHATVRRRPRQPEVVSPSDMVMKKAGIFRKWYEPKGLEVLVEANANGTVLMDPGRLEQVLENLASNAAYAMVRGGTLRLRTADEQDEIHRYVRLTVEDDGPGIPPEVQERMYEPFVTTKADGGTGLGLYTVRSIVRDAGGEIICDSGPWGTRFDVRLQRVNGEGMDAKKPIEQRRMRASRLLIVEDDLAVLQLYRRALPRYGVSLREAPNVETALAGLEEFDPEAIVLDVHLGFGTSQAVLDYARRRDGLLGRHTPIIVASGSPEDEGRVHGADAYLAKPFQIADLVSKIAEAERS